MVQATKPREDAHPEAVIGGLAAGIGYAFWGLSVIYYKQLAIVPPFETLAHRTFWSAVTIALVALIAKRGPHILQVFRNGWLLRRLICTSLLVSTNWFVFIYAIAKGNILATSFGYYINPLMSVLLGVILLRKRLPKAQIFAIALAVLGVMNFTYAFGSLPLISLYLAASFALYGYLRKVTPVNPLDGLFVEIVILAPFALAFLWYLHTQNAEHFNMGPGLPALYLVLTGPMTVAPLLLFAYGARRIRMATLGLMQYLLPTMSFLVAIFLYSEPFEDAQIITFALIWTGLAIFSFDLWKRERASRAAAAIVV
jgi:chloramphenicol-sensitive protein RarD